MSFREITKAFLLDNYTDMEFFSIILAILGFYWIHQRLHSRKFPHGPRGLPVVGYLPFLGKYPYETLFKLGEKYGSIFSIALGSETVVILNDWAAVKAALVDQAQTFSGRPKMFILDSTVHKKDIATNDGPIWKSQRNFAIQTLKLVGPDSSDKESFFMDHVNKLIEKFEKQNGQIICIKENFFLPIFNTVWQMSCSKTIENDDDVKAKQFFEILKQNFYGFRNNSPVNFMPFLRYLVPGGFGYWTYVDYHNKLRSYMEEQIQEHHNTFKEGICRDFVDAHIEEIHKRQQQNEKMEPPFTFDNLTGTLFDLFLAGVETMSNTLTWGILALSVWPQFQDKIQEELDIVIGRGRTPVLEDITMLPYLEAVTMEIHRYISLAPLSLFHSPTKDTEVLGHPIPKGCTVIQNIYGVHRDPKCWDNPFEFQSERFLDSQNRVQKPKCLIPFSTGARKCLGANFAKQTIFLFLACILQKLSFRLPPNSPQPSWEPIVGLSLNPKPFSVIVNVR